MMKQDAEMIIREAIQTVMPEEAVCKALREKNFESERIFVVAIGKAAWRMAKAANDILGNRIVESVVITKYQHSFGEIARTQIIEAGHPIPDENSLIGTEKALRLVKELSEEDQLVFLISGGGSALFEKPLDNISLNDLIDINAQLLASGASIVEINTVRKHLSSVKGGRFAQLCKAPIYSIVLSDVIGDQLDSIASGPAFPDGTTSKDALLVVNKYGISLGEGVQEVLSVETPKRLENVETIISGNVRILCNSAANIASKLGYEPYIITTCLSSEAKEVGKVLAAIAKELVEQNSVSMFNKPCAIIFGGESVVRLVGNGKGGRNQEIALASAIEIEGVERVTIFSVGSDGTDGPTDAAGGIVDGSTASMIRASGRSPEVELDNNNAFYALEAADALCFTGATGTNVNDLMVILCR